MRRGALGLGLSLALAMSEPAQSGGLTYRILDWDQLDRWSLDDHSAALDVYRQTCTAMEGADWKAVCAYAESAEDPRAFFELLFRPVLIEDGGDPLFTGYYEPELEGSLRRTGEYQFALYRKPPEVQAGQPWLTRGEIERTGALNGRGLELVWLKDPVEKFFLQIQGSGRIRLPDGKAIRVGYGGKNGYPYRSVGNEMVRRGLLARHEVSAARIKSWVERNPKAGRELLWYNPSYVFFREVSRVPADKGPLGAMNRSITAGRSIAVDKNVVPLGAPVWLEKAGRDPIRRLMIAQDTGSAINGAQRADIFYGTGEAAGREAGRIRDGGRMIVLMPIERALALVNGG